MIDEEREDGMIAEVDTAGSERSKAEPVADATVEAVAAPIRQDEADEPTISTEQFGVVAPLLVPTPAFTAAAPLTPRTNSRLLQTPISARCSSTMQYRRNRR